MYRDLDIPLEGVTLFDQSGNFRGVTDANGRLVLETEVPPSGRLVVESW